jgi:hypothetical protein
MSDARLISDNEQDRAAGEEWWKSSSKEVKLQVLQLITMPWKDPAMQVMSRLAQLAYGEMLERFGE